MPEQIVKANGLEFFTVIEGDPNGKPVLLLHGFPESWWQWRSLTAHLVSLGYRVIVPNQRGYHRSSKPSSWRDYHIDVLAQDAVSLMEALGYTEFDLVGHDWGGFVAWQVALLFPTRVKKMVVLNSSLLRIYTRKLLTFNPTQLLKSWYVFFFQFPFLPETMLARFLRNLLVKHTSKSTTFTSEDMAHYENSWLTDHAIKTMIAWYQNAMRTTLLTFYGELFRFRNPYKKFPLPTVKIQSPTLVLWGDDDVFLTKQLAIDSLAHCEQGQIKSFANVSHWITHDIPEAVNKEVAGFFHT